MKSNKEEFIRKAKIVHAGENLDYSQVEYVNNRTPVKIIDLDVDENGNIYGEFWQTPSNHLKGQCHPRKRGKKISLNKRSKQDEIIERFEAVHKGENLDYSQVKYVNMHTKVKIICHDLRPDGSEYGEFWQEPCVHLRGCTHPELGKNKSRESQRYTTDKFIELAKLVHKGDKYTYELVDYTASQKKVKINCHQVGSNGREHGIFLINPDAFLQGKGCPRCGNHLSTAEDEIYAHIAEHFGESGVEKGNTTILDGKEIDVYVPEKKVGFEFNGIRWHSEQFNKDKYYHLKKKEAAEKVGVTLIHIFEDEYLRSKEIVLDKIDSILGIVSEKKKAYGRTVGVKEITRQEAKDFLDKFHIQGYVASTKYLGAFSENVLVAVMTFTHDGSDKWNLSRYCTNSDYICPGVAGKMFNYFVKHYRPAEVKSFLDKRWARIGEPNLYTKIGFKKDYELGPEYRYTNGHGEREHKFKFRKAKLIKKYGFDASETESEMAKKLGYYKIWDCGLIKYVWKKETQD